MSQTVDLGENGVVEFPDEFTPEQMGAAIKKKFGSQLGAKTGFQFAPPAEPETKTEWYKPGEWLKPQGAIPGMLQTGQKGIGETMQGAANVLATVPIGAGSTVPGMSSYLQGVDPEIAAENKRRRELLQNPLKLRQQMATDQLNVAGQALAQTAAETHPIPESAKASPWTAIGEAAGGFVPAVISGPLAPVQIGLQQMGAHIDADFEAAKKEGKSDDEAATKAFNRALASGATAAAIWSILPAPLRKASDKWIIDKFAPAIGESAVKRWVAGRAAQMGEQAVLMGTSGGGEAAVTGQPILPAIAKGAMAGAAIGAWMPHGPSKGETDARIAEAEQVRDVIGKAQEQRQLEQDKTQKAAQIESAIDTLSKKVATKLDPDQVEALNQESDEVLLELAKDPGAISRGNFNAKVNAARANVGLAKNRPTKIETPTAPATTAPTAVAPAVPQDQNAPIGDQRRIEISKSIAEQKDIPAEMVQPGEETLLGPAYVLKDGVWVYQPKWTSMAPIGQPESESAAGGAKPELTPAQVKEQAIKKRIAEGVDPNHIRIAISKYPEMPQANNIQVDELHPELGNTFSSNPDQLKALGMDIPDSQTLMQLPHGAYTLPEALKKLAERKHEAESQKQVSEAGQIPPVVGQPPVAEAEVQAQGGVAQPQGPGQAPAELTPPTRGPGIPFTVSTPRSEANVSGHYDVVDLGTLTTSNQAGFDQALQPRDRSRQASVEQINQIEQSLQPHRLAESHTSDLGAPFVNDRNMALSGNARLMALRLHYDRDGSLYKNWLVQNADQFGFKPDAVAKMERPVLVRRVTDYGGLDEPTFADYSNRQQVAGMSPAEKARADAMWLTRNTNILDLFAPSEDGDIMAASNRSFLMAFVNNVGDKESLLTATGFNDAEVSKRVKNALLGLVLGHERSDLITTLIENSAELNMSNVVNGVMRVTPRLMKLRGTAYDVTTQIGQAITDQIRLKRTGEKIEDFLGTHDIFGDAGRTAESDALLVLLHKSKSATQVADAISRYVASALQAAEDAKSGGLFGEKPRSPAEILKVINENKPASIQTGLSFGKPTPASPQAGEPPGSPAPVGAPPVEPAPVAPVEPVRPVAPSSVTAEAADAFAKVKEQLQGGVPDQRIIGAALRPLSETQLEEVLNLAKADPDYSVSSNVPTMVRHERKYYPRSKPSEVIPPDQQAMLDAARRYRIRGGGPATYNIIERLPQTEIEKANGEQPVRIRNERTKEESVLTEAELQPVKTLSAAEKAAAKAGKMTDADITKELIEKYGHKPIGVNALDAAQRKALWDRDVASRAKHRQKIGTAENTFYSRITRTIEQSTQGKATGAQWKATIRNSKMGVNRDEFALVRVEDLEDGKTYTRQEVLDYLKANKVVVKDVTLGGDIIESGDPYLWGTVTQELPSASTSINEHKLPATFSRVKFERGTVNADIGGGAFDNATDYLKGEGVENVIFDPFNRPQAENDAAVFRIRNGQSDTATVNNVLNVIKEPRNRLKVIAQAANAIKADGTAYFLIYEGDGSGVGRPTKPGSWQENRKASSYVDEISQHFSEFKRVGNLIEASKPRHDIQQSQTHFSTYQLPGAKEGSYREVLLTVPRRQATMDEARAWVRDQQAKEDSGYSAVPFDNWTDAQKEKARHLAEIHKGPDLWRDGHSQYADIPNPIVRLRFNERTTADGKRMLFLEEVQAPQKGEFEKMPALFQKNWREIAFKWALRHAAENGFDTLGYTTGEQQAERYDLSKHVDSITVKRSATDQDWVVQGMKGNTHVVGHRITDLNELDAVIGKDLGAKARADLEKLPDSADRAFPGETQQPDKYDGVTYSGVDLKIGGAGLAKLYDVDFRNVVNNLAAVKKAGQKVGTVEVGTGDKPRFVIADGQSPNAAKVRMRLQEIQKTWDGPERTAAGWQNWNVTLNKSAEQVLRNMEFNDKSYQESMDAYGSIELGDKLGLGGDWEKSAVKDAVHSLSITPEIRESVMGGQAMFSLGKPGSAPEYSKVPAKPLTPEETRKVGEAYQELAKRSESFQFKTTDAKTPKEIAAALSPKPGAIKVTYGLGDIEFSIGDSAIIIKDSHTDRPYVNSSYADSAGTEGGQGTRLYHLVFTWAHNNGKTIYPSPVRLTEINVLRRTSNMLASALRFKTTDHIEPAPEQGVKWVKGDTWGNIARLAAREAELVDSVYGEQLKGYEYNIDTGRLGTRGGTDILGRTDFERISRGIREAKLFQPGAPGESGIGRATIQRTLFTRAARDYEYHDAGHADVGQRVAVGSAAGRLRFGLPLEKILYSHGELVDAPIGEAEARAAVAKEIGKATNVSFISDPNAVAADVTLVPGQRGKIVLNRAKLDSPAAVKDALYEELIHAVIDHPSVRDAVRNLNAMVDGSSIAKKIKEGYEMDVAPEEAVNQIIRELREKYDKSGWWNKVVTQVVIAVKRLFGIDLSREEAAVHIVNEALKNRPYVGEEMRQRFSRLARNPAEYEKQKFFKEAAFAEGTAGALGDPVRMKQQIADELKLSDRSRRLLNLPKESELYARAIGDADSIYGYADARQWAKDKTPTERWHVTQDALQSLGNDERRSLAVKEQYQKKLIRIESPAFAAKQLRLMRREFRMEYAVEKEEAFRNIKAGEVANLEAQLRSKATTEAAAEVARNSLEIVHDQLTYAAATAIKMDDIVGRLYDYATGQKLEYWSWFRPDQKSGDEFAKLYFQEMARRGTPVTDPTQQMIAKMAANTLAVNYKLAKQLFWRERYNREPDFAKAVNAVGKAFVERLKDNPAKAIKEIVAREGKLSAVAAQAKEAFLSLQKDVMREVEDFSDFEGAVMADQTLKASKEWRALANQVNADAGAFGIPEVLRDEVRKGKFNDFTGKLIKTDPTGKVHEVDLGWTKQDAQKAQDGIETYLHAVEDWLHLPENADHPDRGFWEREHDFIDAVYNTMGVLSPGAVKGFGAKFMRRAWGMPEFLFRQVKLPVGKVLQTAFENWHRANAVSAQWSSATDQPLMAKIIAAGKSHGFKMSMGTQGYRDAVFNSLAWAYRHNIALKTGDVLYGINITAQDVALLKAMGTAENNLFNSVKNLGAERIMPQDLLFDEWASGAFSIRRAQEFGAEPGTTVSRNFSARGKMLAEKMAKIKPNDYAGMMSVLNGDAGWQFVLRWLHERSADYSTPSEYEPFFKQIVDKINGREADAPRSVEEIVDYISINTDETHTPEQITDATVGQMYREVASFYERFLKEAPEDSNEVQVIRATRDSPFTTGFKQDVGNSFFYDYGMMNRQEVRATAIDSTMFHLTRLERALHSAEDVYGKAIRDLDEVKNDETKRLAVMKKHQALFQSGDDFRDFEDLRMHHDEIKYFRDKLPVWTGKQVARYEGMTTLYRLVGDNVLSTLGGLMTTSRVLTGSIVKQGFVLSAFERFAPLAYAKAALSMAMSTFDIGVMGPVKFAGRRLGLVQELKEPMSGWLEEIFRNGKFFDQQYRYGLGTKTPTLNTIFNNFRTPYTHGGGYNVELSGNAGMRLLQKGAFRVLSAAEAPLELVRTIFPSMSYSIAYDSVARQIYWSVKSLEGRARRTFDTYERLGKLSRFDLANPAKLQNRLNPREILADGFMPTTVTQLSQVREFFKRGTDQDLNEAVMRFWARLAETPKDQRGNVHFLEDAAADPAQAKHLYEARMGALASIGLFDIHHASPVNRMWALREASFGRLAWPIAGWAIQSTRQIFGLLGKGAADPRFGPKMLTAITIATGLAAMGMSGIGGDLEKRFFSWIKWLAYKEIDPVKHFGQGKDAKENAQIAISDVTGYITVLNNLVDSLIGEKSNRSAAIENIFVVEKIKSLTQYVSGVVHSGDALFGVAALAKRDAPWLRPVLNRLPSQDGLVVRNNVRALLGKYGPEELIRKGSFGAGAPVVTELSPAKEKLTNALYKGDGQGVMDASQEFLQIANKLGRTDAQKLLSEVVRSVHPYALGLVGRPTEAQREEMLAKMTPAEREVLLKAEQNYLAGSQSIGVDTNLTKREGGMGGAGVAGAGDSLSLPRIPSISRVSGVNLPSEPKISGFSPRGGGISGVSSGIPRVGAGIGPGRAATGGVRVRRATVPGVRTGLRRAAMHGLRPRLRKSASIRHRVPVRSSKPRKVRVRYAGR